MTRYLLHTKVHIYAPLREFKKRFNEQMNTYLAPVSAACACCRSWQCTRWLWWPQWRRGLLQSDQLWSPASSRSQAWHIWGLFGFYTKIWAVKSKNVLFKKSNGTILGSEKMVIEQLIKSCQVKDHFFLDNQPAFIRLFLPERITLGVGSGGVGVHPEHIRLGCAHVLDWK